VPEKLLLDGVAVEASNCAKPPSNRRTSPATLLEVATEALDVSAPGFEKTDVVLLAPGGELAQVERVSLAGEPAVTGEESGESDPLGIAKH
jgi:hypothetical protein